VIFDFEPSSSTLDRKSKIENRKSQIPEVRIPAWNLLPAEMFRVKTFEADMAIFQRPVFLNENGAFGFGIWDMGFGI
jgi:hypothetical protein